MLNSVHIITAEKPNTEPTERSNSPAVISSVIGRAIRPSSTVKVSVLPILPAEMNCGLIAENTTSSSTSRTKGPNSGRATSDLITAESFEKAGAHAGRPLLTAATCPT